MIKLLIPKWQKRKKKKRGIKGRKCAGLFEKCRCKESSTIMIHPILDQQTLPGKKAYEEDEGSVRNYKGPIQSIAFKHSTRWYSFSQQIAYQRKTYRDGVCKPHGWNFMRPDANNKLFNLVPKRNFNPLQRFFAKWQFASSHTVFWLELAKHFSNSSATTLVSRPDDIPINSHFDYVKLLIFKLKKVSFCIQE